MSGRRQIGPRHDAFDDVEGDAARRRLGKPVAWRDRPEGRLIDRNSRMRAETAGMIASAPFGIGRQAGGGQIGSAAVMGADRAKQRDRFGGRTAQGPERRPRSGGAADETGNGQHQATDDHGDEARRPQT
ncbi:hypothetical protein [Prosthecomicrobium hirschii]|uniref:hypothetical protein n=1 Tax=Prosthecodimorpha hirschii TaxID=665126 RepID=UPI00221F5059|nr:hypothetical protein [Prosthecomicrobium hirschii]MCW1838818.1 hypothetical protein [Prosthecomicrobium hirschii]